MSDEDFQRSCSALMSSPYRATLEEAVRRKKDATFAEWLSSSPDDTVRRDTLYREATASSALLDLIDNNAAVSGMNKVQDK